MNTIEIPEKYEAWVATSAAKQPVVVNNAGIAQSHQQYPGISHDLGRARML